MANKLFGVFMFIAGAAAGAAVAWKLTKTKYEQIAEEEIDSVKEVFSRRLKDEREKNTDEITKDGESIQKGLADGIKKDKPDLSEYVKRINSEGYSDNKEKGGGDMVNKKPYIIKEEDFGEMDGYENICLTYYSDKVLADEFDEIIYDIDGTIGEESLNHFGEEEPNYLFVRNDNLKCDYEVVLDPSTYTDVVNQPSEKVERWQEE